MNAAAGLRELLDSDAKRARLSRTERAKLRATLAALETMERERRTAHALAAALQNLLDTVGEVCPDLDADVMREGCEALAEYNATAVRKVQP